MIFCLCLLSIRCTCLRFFFSAEKHTEHCAMLCAPKTAQKWKTQMEREATKRENENVGNQQQKCQVRSTMSISRIHTEVETPAIA